MKDFALGIAWKQRRARLLFTFCLRQGTHRCTVYRFGPGKLKSRLFLSCGLTAEL